MVKKCCCTNPPSSSMMGLMSSSSGNIGYVWGCGCGVLRTWGEFQGIPIPDYMPVSAQLIVSDEFCSWDYSTEIATQIYLQTSYVQKLNGIGTGPTTGDSFCHKQCLWIGPPIELVTWGNGTGNTCPDHGPATGQIGAVIVCSQPQNVPAFINPYVPSFGGYVGTALFSNITNYNNLIAGTGSSFSPGAAQSPTFVCSPTFLATFSYLPRLAMRFSNPDCDFCEWNLLGGDVWGSAVVNVSIGG